MHFLLLNGAGVFGSSKGRLNASLVQLAKETLEGLGHETEQTEIEKSFDPAQEAQKILRSDVIILHLPMWWMGEPWFVKKYIDEVFSAGGATGKFLTGDGRHRTDPKHGYGTGGLLKDKKFLLCVTCNAPREAFEEPEQFFEGQGVRGIFLHLYKAFEFIGIKGLPPFLADDCMKNPDYAAYVAKYQQKLKELFGK
jgi:modulator of drug activity B